jgi:hypothetical protein
MKLRRSDESGCLRQVWDASLSKFVFCLATLATGLLSSGGPALGQALPCELFGNWFDPNTSTGGLISVDLATGAGTAIGAFAVPARISNVTRTVTASCAKSGFWVPTRPSA